MCRTFLRKNCIWCATVNPVYTTTHGYTPMLHTHTFYHAHLLSQMEGNYDVDFFQPSKDFAQSQTSSYFLSHYVKIIRFPLRPFIHTYLPGNRVPIHFFFVIQYDKCFQSFSKKKKRTI